MNNSGLKNNQSISLNEENQKIVLGSIEDLFNNSLTRNQKKYIELLSKELRLDPDINVYEKLEDNSFKKMIDAMYENIQNNESEEVKPTKEELTKVVIGSISGKVNIKKEIKSIKKEIDSNFAEINLALHDKYKDMYQELFDRLEEIKKSDPEKGEQLQKCKDAFDNSKTFDVPLKFLEKESVKNVKKYANKYLSYVHDFNTLINNENALAKVPNINTLYPVIRSKLKDYPKDSVKEFIVLLCKSLSEIDTSKLENFIYVYKTVDNIYKYSIAKKGYTDEDTEILFKNIANVIDQIKLKKGR